jgi:hypothetical protein
LKLTWTDDNLLRQVVYEALREDKPPAEVQRALPRPKPGATGEYPQVKYFRPRWRAERAVHLQDVKSG